VKSFTRISQEKIWVREQIRNPNIVIILDPSVLSQLIVDNIKDNGILIINTNKSPEEIEQQFHIQIPVGKNFTVATVDVNKICFENHLLLEGSPIVNTPILGALSKVLPELPLSVIKEAISDHLGGGEKAKLNVMAADFAAALTKIKKFE
jgi:2-oxoacid:acceptor oxidoreductase gamma subunit (pyruvate/2-ketoisovalerate family)